MFTHDEITALVAGARILQTWGGTRMAAAAQEALVKIDTVLPEAARQKVGQVKVHAVDMPWHGGSWRDHIDQFEAASEKHYRLKISYEDENGTATVRTIRPLGVWFWGKVWTAVCWCELRRDFRMFRLDRILTIQDAGAFRPERGQTLKDFMETKSYLR